MTSPAIRILLADDHALIREALRQILNSCSSFEVVGEAASAAGTIELVRSTQAQILILDLSMPDRNAIEVIRVVKDIEPAIRILVLTMHGERQYAVCAFRASATRYAAASVFERPRTRCIPAQATAKSCECKARSTHLPISTTCRNRPARAAGSARLTAPTPAS
jgi:DNA-binding NarL/FixJ family response regulator